MADYTSSNTGAVIDAAVDYVEILDNYLTISSNELIITGQTGVGSDTVLLNLKANNSAGQAGNILRFTDTDPTAVNNGSMGKVQWFSTTTGAVVAEINGKNDDTTPDGQLIISTAAGASLTQRIDINADGDIQFFNAAGTSRDLHWDATDSRLGINVTTPTEALDVLGNANFTGTVTADGITNAGIITTDDYFGLGSTYNRIADRDTSGAFGGGYNFYVDGTTPKHDSTGTLAGYYYTSGGEIRLYASPSSAPDTAAIERIRIANNGDISFYEDTGTTPKFFWDASAERLGVGTITPNAPVDAQLSGIGGLPVSSGTSQTYGSLRVGATSFNTILDMGTAGGTGAWLQASDRTALGTNYSLLLNPNGGNVGIGVSPGVALDINRATSTASYARVGNGGNVQAYIGVAGDNLPVVGSFTNHDLRMVVNAAEVARFDTSGNLLLNESSVSGNAEKFRLTSGGTSSVTAAALFNNSAGTELFFVRSDGAFRTGSAAASPYNNTAAVTANLFVNTDGTLVRATSSRRYKKDIVDARFGLSDLLNLRPVNYKGINSEVDEDIVYGGLIAEEVHDAGLTEFVEYNKENQPDALRYQHMVSLCIKAIQEQQDLIESLTARIAALEGAN